MAMSARAQKAGESLREMIREASEGPPIDAAFIDALWADHRASEAQEASDDAEE